MTSDNLKVYYTKFCPHTGVSLQPYTGDNPMGALLILADSPVETVFQDSVFYRLPAPALAVVNSTARLNNTEVGVQLKDDIGC